MAIFDKNNLVDNAVAITGTGQSAWKDLGTPPAKGHTLRAVVSAVGGTNPTLDLTLEFSDNASTVKEKIVLPQLTAADLGLDKLISHAIQRRYVRRNCTAIGGTDTPTFTVTIGVTDYDLHPGR